MPVSHYENFPVASWLLPRGLREPIEAIYGFARGADDVADEGNASDAERLEGLDRYRQALDAIEARRRPEAAFTRIAHAVMLYDLPVVLLRDLIDAFAQDVVKKRYATFAELRDYSRRSADPVGRLLVHLFERTGTHAFRIPMDGDEARARSDDICSALQYINFWQDVPIDWRKGRVYIPQEDLARFGVEETSIARGLADQPWQSLMAFECARARSMLLAGAPLGDALTGRMGLEIRVTVQGGLAILDRIEAARGDVFARRPVLTRADWARMIARALLRTRPR